MCADIVVVGGGPVGLWTAIQAKKRYPNQDIQVYERYQEYARSHVLKLERMSLMLYSKRANDAAEKTFMEAVLGSHNHNIVEAAFDGEDDVYIRTNDLEDALKTYAENLGIQTAYQHIDSPEMVEAMHPECDNFIAADGAHSKMRLALMGENSKKEYPLQHVVEMKYEADGKTGSLDTAENFRVNKNLDSMAFEYVGKEKDGKTPVTLRFFVDEEIYNTMPEASFKQPLTLETSKLPDNLTADIELYMDARKEKLGEQYKNGSSKISKLTLSLYRAKKFAMQKRKKNWFLVGDAAMGVPYFRSLNAGLIIGSQLGKIITSTGLSGKSKIAAYNTLQPLDTTWEFTSAHGKNVVLNIYDSFRKASGKVSSLFKPKKKRGGPGLF